jgi:hypothetical protein
MIERHPKACFYLFCFFYALAWTLGPTFFRTLLPVDALEGYVWGQHFQWGYDKNPWLNAVLTHFAVEVGGYSGWLVYGMSQLFVFMAFWSVWRLGVCRTYRVSDKKIRFSSKSRAPNFKSCALKSA